MFCIFRNGEELFRSGKYKTYKKKNTTNGSDTPLNIYSIIVFKNISKLAGPVQALVKLIWVYSVTAVLFCLV